MKKTYLLFLIAILSGGLSLSASAQQLVWSVNNDSTDAMNKNKAVLRRSFPKQFRLFNLNPDALRQQLFSIVDDSAQRSAVIFLPNADGALEQFEVFEASNFEPALQARFPDIRAFSGRGITDKYATLKLSFSPDGIQSTVFRAGSDGSQTGGETEIIEPYDAAQTVYAVFRSARRTKELPWACSTADYRLFSNWKSQIDTPASNNSVIRTLRLAQSCNGEYSNYFGAFNSSQVALVLAGINATLTRANGVYEKDLAVHLNLIPETTSIIFYDPATDPYSTTLSDWNAELAGAIAAAGITPAMYDIGHMFGASGGGGNAGCIGCVCSTDHEKGMGITSPADGIPQGDNFDIDFVVHEVGHQLGANHTFSYGQLPVPEMMGQDKEVGSGITIMGYAGVTDVDAAPHSIDSYHATSIDQIQVNLPTRPLPCGTTTAMTANHPPVVAPVPNYTIPHTTPFELTGSATDPDGDSVTYNWEQNDSAQDTGTTLAASNAYPGKLIGPNWLSFATTSSPKKMFPKLSTILAGQFTTSATGTDDAVPLVIESLSSVTRDLHFRLTVRDNHPYVPGSAIGQTQFTDMTVSVTNTSGPFLVTAPNSNVSWAGGSSQTVTWAAANTTLPPVSCASVKISLSTDGGTTFPTVLAASTANSGSAVVTMPSISSTTARVKIEAIGNIFFDISDTNFTIVGPTPTATATATPTPTGNITGTVTYGNAIGAPASRAISSVLISASGSPNVSGSTDASGTYSLTGFGSGSYAASASRSGGQNGSITSLDAARIAQFVTGNATFTAAQTTVADVSGNSDVSSYDAALIARYVASLGSPTGSSGSWRFSPSFRAYPSVSGTISGQDYSGLLMGEVSGNWTDTGSRAAGWTQGVTVDLQRVRTRVDGEILIPVAIQGVKDKGIIAYQFDLRYDPTVIRPQIYPIDLAGTASLGLAAVINAEQPGLLRVVMYGAYPVEADGVLVKLRFNATGAPGSVSPLIIEHLIFNEDPEVRVGEASVELF